MMLLLMLMQRLHHPLCVAAFDDFAPRGAEREREREDERDGTSQLS